MGGTRILTIRWAGPATIIVDFASVLSSDFVYQLYAGRRKIAETEHPAARQFSTHYRPSDWPEVFQILAVSGNDIRGEHGDGLPPRAYNVARIRSTVSGWPADAEFLDLYHSPAPGAAVDTDNRAARQFYRGDRTYEFLTDPLPGTGTYQFRLEGRDNRPAAGNVGTAVTGSVDILATPPDLVRSAGQRFGISFADGTATLTATLPD